jgi:multidrug efflux system membrane fusion protein
MASIFKPSRIIAVALILAAGAWIYSGQLMPKAEEEPAAATPAPAKAAAPVPVQKVGITTATAEKHQQQIVLSCTTQADRRSWAVSRGAGIVVELKVRRGSPVRSNDVIAAISDEGRVSAVKQAQALLQQRRADLEVNKKLIDRGDAPKNTLPGLEAVVAAAEAALASAQAEADKSFIKSAIDGIVNNVPVEVGQAIQPGAQIAEVVGPDPMLAVGAVSERQRGHLVIGENASVRFIDGAVRNGTISFVSLSSDKATRTYTVEARMPNPDAAIADGVTCEMTVSLDPVEAAAVPRSALVFSDDGRLGVRVADEKSQAKFMPISIVDDGREMVWVSGLTGASRVIVVGQDFVRDGDPVEAVSAAEASPRPKAEPPA